MGPRIQLMLQQLEFKLSVEQQYKRGIEKMLKLYQIEGDRRSKAEAENKQIDSTQKIQLLKKALKRYSDMHIDIDDEFTGEDNESIAAANMRRPLSGVLHIACYGIQGVDHVASGRFAKVPESAIAIKVEDQPRAKTKFTRSDRWSEEFNLSVDKANEVEIVAYDRSGDHDIPVAIMWLRISDIAEALRRKKVEQEIHSAGWVSASKVQSSDNGAATDLPYGGQRSAYPSNGSGFDSSGSAPLSGNHGGATNSFTAGTDPSTGLMTIDGWFVLEPAGKIHLTLGFEKTSRGQKRTYDNFGALGRQGAIRQKKEEVHEVHGHKFVQHQFYNIMRCALCGDFLKYSAGYQCQDCRYTCHKKCYPKVVTKCISKASTESDPDEEKLNHRIYHRFEPTTNMSANWCCHCGYILPLGKKNVRKCTECGLTCHPQCAHLVPDLCGLSMEAANQILSEIKSTKIRQKATSALGPAGKPSVTSPTKPTAQPLSPQSQYSVNSGGSVNPYGVRNVSSTSTFAPPPPKKEPIRRKEVGTPSSITGAVAQSNNQQAPVVQPMPAKPRDYGSTAVNYQKQQVGASPQNMQAQQPPQPHHERKRSEAAVSGYNVDAALQAGSLGNGQLLNGAQPTNARAQEDSYEQQRIRPVTSGIDSHVQSAPRSPSPTKQQKSMALSPPSPKKKAKKKKVGLDDFNFVSVLGKGNFGKVMLAESKKSKNLYAIKVLKKDFIIENDEVESTRSEKRVFLIAMKHPFLTNLHSCFQTENRVYFVMEYVSGGDLMWHIQKDLFTPRRAQFYAAEVLLALKYFHDNGVIYRDLKLDNILLTLSGHIKIADYGLCKEDMWYGKTTGTFCGTPEFMAPEILLEQKYGRAVDWWAFGVLIYQMLLGKSPFRGDDEDEVFDAILSDEPLYPIHMPRDSVSILQQLLNRDPEKRLGAGPRDAEEIMGHPYFRNINFDDIYNMRVAPPYVPQITSATDVSNFDTEFTDEPPALTPVNSILTAQMQEQFKGFSYMNEDYL